MKSLVLWYPISKVQTDAAGPICKQSVLLEDWLDVEAVVSESLRIERLIAARGAPMLFVKRLEGLVGRRGCRL